MAKTIKNNKPDWQHRELAHNDYPHIRPCPDCGDEIILEAEQLYTCNSCGYKIVTHYTLKRHGEAKE